MIPSASLIPRDFYTCFRFPCVFLALPFQFFSREGGMLYSALRFPWMCVCDPASTLRSRLIGLHSALCKFLLIELIRVAQTHTAPGCLPAACVAPSRINSLQPLPRFLFKLYNRERTSRHGVASRIEPLPLNDEACEWFSRMEASRQILETSCGNAIDAKTYLIAVIGKDALTVLKDLLAPEKIDAVKYDKMKETLLKHLVRQRLVIAERFAFYSVSQEDGESVSVFFSRLKKASEHCDFGSYLEDMLRDRLVLGCNSADARRKLLQTDSLTLANTLDILRSFEAVRLAKGEMTIPVHKVNSSKASHSKGNSRHKTYDAAAKAFPTTDRFSASPRKQFLSSSQDSSGKHCFRCGAKGFSRSHDCPALNQTCAACGKMNHFARVCKSKSQHHVDIEPDSPTSDDILHVHSLPAGARSSRVTLRIQNQEIVMEVDTGAAASVISQSVWIELGSPALIPSDKIFTAYDGHRIRPLGRFTTSLSRGDQTVHAELTVLKADRSFGLLGRDLIPLLVPESNIAAIHSTDEYLPAMKVQPATIEKLPHTRNIFCKARPVPLPLADIVKDELDSLERRGVIAPVSSSECASPVVWVKKKTGGLRMCADFSVHVNQSIKSDSFPMPRIETVFAGLAGSRYFAKLDLKEAYWQIPIDKQSQGLCTLNTSNGLYKMLRLPKGLKNSSAIFQRTMETILKDLPGIVVYQDDVLLHASTRDDLARRVTAVMKRLEQKNVSINDEKSVLIADNIQFLGHELSADGIRPSASLTEKLLGIQPPASIKELHSFLGLVNFFGRMIPDFAGGVSPLNELRKKGVPFVW